MYPLEVPAKNTAQEVRFLLRALKLKKGQGLLDLGCGVGRHSIPLARAGFRVTGFDLTQRYLAQAKRRAIGSSIRWVRGDMRRLPFQNEFDAAINMFTSFGYFSNIQDDLQVLRAVHRALKPRGVFFLDTFNGEYNRLNFRDQIWEELGGGRFVLRSNAWKERDGIFTDWIFIDLRRGVGRGRSFIRMYDKKRISGLLRKTGFRPLRFWGDFQGHSYAPQRKRLMVLARKVL
ncbi:MAG: class I SAM-dependent methyltransferase [Elusimicrobia bacterium]|nr:class I SAM-dependent methyltransferase [Elusimicrobiota bacterium]